MSSSRIRDSSFFTLWRCIILKKRAKTNRPIDKKIFTRTASTVKAVNLPQKIYRGGIRF